MSNATSSAETRSNAVLLEALTNIRTALLIAEKADNRLGWFRAGSVEVSNAVHAARGALEDAELVLYEELDALGLAPL